MRSLSRGAEPGRRFVRTAVHRLRNVVLRRKTRSDSSWFDHPEMQARIAKAEADRREGRVTRFESREAAVDWINSLT